ncbi:glycosyltransferase family 2 protein [Streptomyces sp. V4I2]|uniref:glycosyltransferase family 2 protein n=1 Tax=Streptomyces sp. V4I2 TaxID=3042280 RepID=UPI00278AFDDE|nr:glycosyltransferase family 2 protein [Streptomyces sp. V4I2]MDQ1050199.1 glycosyltransferase involved in cell wall biosynthesis [Streptomyces sp. V4I2]
MRILSIVIPAFNEALNLPPVMATIPVTKLESAGWETEVLVVDNASTDGTGDVARSLGARVVLQPERGYGNAYHAGFAAATGDVIATGDADCTYPFDILPYLLRILVDRNVEFLTTNRLSRDNKDAMQALNSFGNHALSAVSRTLFHNGLRDSQSGMWVLHRHVWQSLDIRSTGMAFSQELKNAATLAGYRYIEVPIEYRKRGGEVKLHAIHDGMANLLQLFEHRLRKTRPQQLPTEVGLAEGTTAPHASRSGATR